MTSLEFFEWVIYANCIEAQSIKNEAINKFRGDGFVESTSQKVERIYKILQYIKSRQPQGTHN
jgi:hypothetical protein